MDGTGFSFYITPSSSPSPPFSFSFSNPISTSTTSSGSIPFGSFTTQSGSGLFGALPISSPALSSSHFAASFSPVGSFSSSPAFAAPHLFGSISAASSFSISFPTASSSASFAPSFAFPAASTASSTSSASGLSFPATPAPGFSFPASSAGSAPGFSLSSGSAAAFSFAKGTGSLATSLGVSSSGIPPLAESSGFFSGFSFATSGFQSPASLSAPAFSTPASKSGFRTVSSPLFSTVTTTSSATTPAATTTASAISTGFTGSAVTYPVSCPAASSAAATVLTSGSAAARSGGLTGIASISTSTTLDMSSGSLSLSTNSPATGTASQPQTTSAAASLESAAVDVGMKQPGDCVEESQGESSESSYIGSEVLAGDEAVVSDAEGCASSVFSLCTDMNDLTLSPQDAQRLIRAILGKSGDITKGSIVKSMVVRSTLLHLVAEVVHRLSNHTIKTLGSDELQLLQKWTDDAVAVGFSVEWLQQRLGKISTASKYHERLVHLDKLGQQIDAVKKSLVEMELQQMVWKKEVDHMKIQLEGVDLEASNLGEGLI